MKSDTQIWAGLACVGLAVAALLFWDDGADGGSRGARTRPRGGRAATAAPGPGGSAQMSPPAAHRLTWPPPQAREVTNRADLPIDDSPTDRCGPQETLVGKAKTAAMVLEQPIRHLTEVSDEDENELGRRIEDKVSKDPKLGGAAWDPPEAVGKYRAYLQQLTDRIAAHQSRKTLSFRVHVVDDPSFNAFALPGGILAVHTGLFDGPHAVQDESELVAILGHEIAHVELRHTVAAYQYAKALLHNTGDLELIVGKLMTLPIGSKYEEEADERGLELAAMAGYDPAAAVRLWKRMAEPRPSGGLAEKVFAEVVDATQTHPPAFARCYSALVNVVRMRSTLGADRYYRGATSLRTRVPGFVKAY